MIVYGDLSVSNISSCVDILKFANKTNTKISAENILSHIPKLSQDLNCDNNFHPARFSFSEININSLKKCLS